VGNGNGGYNGYFRDVYCTGDGKRSKMLGKERTCIWNLEGKVVCLWKARAKKANVNLRQQSGKESTCKYCKEIMRIVSSTAPV